MKRTVQKPSPKRKPASGVQAARRSVGFGKPGAAARRRLSPEQRCAACAGLVDPAKLTCREANELYEVVVWAIGAAIKRLRAAGYYPQDAQDEDATELFDQLNERWAHQGFELLKLIDHHPQP